MSYYRFGEYQRVPPDKDMPEWPRIVTFGLYRANWWRRRVAIEIFVNHVTTFAGFATHEHQVRFAPSARAFWASLWPWQRFLVQLTAWVDWHSRAARRLRKVQAKAVAETRKAPNTSDVLAHYAELDNDLREALREQREAGQLSA